jgi:hypothetical protein
MIDTMTENFISMDFDPSGQTEAWMPEAEFASASGLDLERIRMARKKELADGLWKKNGREVLLSAAGRAELVRILADEDAASAAKKKAAADFDAAMDRDFEVVVKKIPMNPRIVFGEWMGEPVRVRVPDSTRFIPGMKLRARLIERDLYVLVGRGPRFKGRW